MLSTTNFQMVKPERDRKKEIEKSYRYQANMAKC